MDRHLCYRQFFDGIATEYFIEAVNNTLKTILENGEKIDKTKEGSVNLFERILRENNLHLYHDPSLPQPQFHDLLAKYSANVASRGLLSLVSRKAEREGDFQTILALKIIFVGFFFSAKGFDSKYAPTLMFDVIDYLGASEATKKRIEEMVTANLSGKDGCNIHLDKLCEHFIRQVKGIFALCGSF